MTGWMWRGSRWRGGRVPEGDLGQASLTSCCLKQDTRAPLLPSTWITYLTHTNTQSVLHTCVDTDANANSILFGLILQSTHAHRALCRRPYIAVETECSLSCVAALWGFRLGCVQGGFRVELSLCASSLSVIWPVFYSPQPVSFCCWPRGGCLGHFLAAHGIGRCFFSPASAQFHQKL